MNLIEGKGDFKWVANPREPETCNNWACGQNISNHEERIHVRCGDCKRIGPEPDLPGHGRGGRYGLSEDPLPEEMQNLPRYPQGSNSTVNRA
jgi:hypothetical protein